MIGMVQLVAAKPVPRRKKNYRTRKNKIPLFPDDCLHKCLEMLFLPKLLAIDHDAIGSSEADVREKNDLPRPKRRKCFNMFCLKATKNCFFQGDVVRYKSIFGVSSACLSQK